MISQSRLKELVSYDPLTGELAWVGLRKGRSSTVGYRRPDGYLLFTVDYQRDYAHRYAWLYMTGESIPAGSIIDHIDGDPRNNRWNNLRRVSAVQSAVNRGVQANNTSGYKGVKRSTSGKFYAMIQVNRKAIYLGSFTDIREAAEAYLFAALDLHGDYARCE